MGTPTKLILASIFGLLAVSKMFGKKQENMNIHNINSSNLASPTGEPIIKRGCDPSGCGYFGAPRTNHVHQGLDIKVQPGQPIFAPISGRVRNLFVYRGSREMTGIEISNGDIKIKIFYVSVSPNLPTGEMVTVGQYIGDAQNVAAYYNSSTMTIHIHVEVRINGNLVDPEIYFKNLLA